MVEHPEGQIREGVRQVEVSADQAGVRLDNFLTRLQRDREGHVSSPGTEAWRRQRPIFGESYEEKINKPSRCRATTAGLYGSYIDVFDSDYSRLADHIEIFFIIIIKHLLDLIYFSSVFKENIARCSKARSSC